MATHAQVAHRFAQDEGKPIKGFNLFFERREDRSGPVQTIFSHGRHWQIASFTTAPNGQRVVLLRPSLGRSISTTNHTSAVLSALTGRVYGGRTHQGYPIFRVSQPDPAHTSVYAAGHSIRFRFHERNNEWQLEQAAEHYAKAKRRRSTDRAEWDLERAADYFDQAKRYAETFGLPPITAELSEVARAVSEAYEANRLAYEAERAERMRKEVERMAALRVEQAPLFAAWLADEPGSQCPSAYDRDENGSVYIRRHHPTPIDELQTSMGASVPWLHALAAYRVAKLCRSQGTPWKRNGHSIRVGHFQIDQIDEHGNLLAGCHYIAWEHMEALAVREGVL